MNHTEISFQDIIWALKRYFIWILLTVLLFSIGAWVYTKNFIRPMYTTNISMVVFSDVRDTEGVTTGQLTADASVAETFSMLLSSQPVAKAVSDALGGTVSSGAISGMVSAYCNGQIIYVTITASDPQVAYDVANALSDVAPATIRSLARAGEMTPVNRAYLPTAPSSPDISSNVMLGGVFGLFLACAVVIIIALLDTTIWREEDLEHLFDIPVLGSVPSMSVTTVANNHRKGRRR